MEALGAGRKRPKNAGQTVLRVGRRDSYVFLWDSPAECGTVGKYACACGINTSLP